MEIEKRIELEVKATTEIAQALFSRCGQFIGVSALEIEREILRRSANHSHELVEMVLRNNRENLGQDEE